MHSDETNHYEYIKRYASIKHKYIIHTLPTGIGIIFINVLFGLFGVVYLLDGILPATLNIADEKNNPDSFIGERAQHDLKFLTDIGPRVTGSYENEVLAIEFLRQKISYIQQQAHPSQIMEVDLQVASDSQKIGTSVKAYANVQNIVVKLHSHNSSKHSVLINAHFDSATASPGGSDDGINCAIMLEALRKLTWSAEKFQHNIIFLFNGAEEAGLLGAHAFVTKHKWAKGVRVVINLDAIGAGGKLFLFQTGPQQPWLLNYYYKVPHPHAQVIGEEIYQSGILPANTDFTVFRDNGNIVGFNLAFMKNGYRYHSQFDDVKNIPAGSYQHAGNIILSLTRSLANAPELANQQRSQHGNIVYYDFLGLFMISYTTTVAVIIHVIISILSLITAIKSFYDFRTGFSCKSRIYFGLTFAAIMLGWAAAGLFITAVAVSIDALQFTMSWYRNSWIILGLYVIPVFTCLCGVITLFNSFNLKNKKKLSASAHTQIQAHLLRLIWTLILLAGTSLGVRSVYLLLIPILFHTLTSITIQILCIQHSIRKWLIIYILGSIIPSTFLMQQALTIITLTVPILGRVSWDMNPEIYIGILTFVLTVLVTSFYTPLITLVRKPLIILATLSVVFIIFFIIVFTPLGFPYSSNPDSPTPQRFTVYHSHTTYRDKMKNFHNSSNIFALYGDRNGPITIDKYVSELSRHVKSELPVEEPFIKEAISLKVNSKSYHEGSVVKFNFTALGPTYMDIFISSMENVNLTSITLQLPWHTATWNGSLYGISYQQGKGKTPLIFTLDFKTPPHWNKSIAEIFLTGYYSHDRFINKTRQFTYILSKFPTWADVITEHMVSESWIF